MDVTAAVIIEEGRALLALRPRGKRHGGYWEFPGGKVEEGEGLEDCLKRELEEELAMEVEVGERVAEIEHDYGSGPLRLVALRCERLSEGISDIGCEAHRWVGLDGLMMMKLLPPDMRLAEIILAEEGKA